MAAIRPNAPKSMMDFILALCSVRHRLDDVVNADADTERRIFLGIVRRVGPLPGIAQVGVGAEGNDQATLDVLKAPREGHPSRQPEDVGQPFTQFSPAPG